MRAKPNDQSWNRSQTPTGSADTRQSSKIIPLISVVMSVRVLSFGAALAETEGLTWLPDIAPTGEGWCWTTGNGWWLRCDVWLFGNGRYSMVEKLCSFSLLAVKSAMNDAEIRDDG